MHNKKQREKKSRNELTSSLRNVDAGMAMLLRIGLMRKENWPNPESIELSKTASAVAAESPDGKGRDHGIRACVGPIFDGPNDNDQDH
jgi:hypothetical protein